MAFAQVLLIVLAVLTSGHVKAASTEWIGDAHAAVRLVTASDAVGPTDDKVTAGLEFRFAPGWHGYWRTPGDAGLPPTFDWSGSANLERADVSWPVPTRLVVEGLQNASYEGHVLLPVTAVLRRKGEPLDLKVSVAYAACANICRPFQAELALSLQRGTVQPSGDATLIAQARSKVPGSPDAAGIDVRAVSMTGTGATRTLAVDLASRGAPFVHPDLFVETSDAGLPPAPAVVLMDEGRVARLTVQLTDPEAPKIALRLTVVDGTRRAEFAGPADAPATPAGGPDLIAALLSALLGGLILNLMPCVLPVLSLKLLVLARADGDDRRLRRLALAATAVGIVSSFVVIAAALIGLKALGLAIGWGIQFQQPWFLAFMASVTVLFALNLFDRLAIMLPSRIAAALSGNARGPLPGAFLSGAFATLLATPCSAPFVGTAVGFALARGPGDILAIFMALGIGMGMPFGIAAVLPSAARLLPRPGPWMPVLRHVLGLLLLGTAAWLLAVLWSVAGAGTASLVTLALVGFGGVVLLTGRAQTRGGLTVWRSAAAVFALLPAALALVMPGAEEPAHEPDAGWTAFDPSAVPGLVAGGKTVLIDVTASWCLTCKVNEVAAFGRPDVEARLTATNVIRMRADWSRPDPAITSYLQGFARYGIPLDVVYGPGRPAGEPLPELLTPQIVTTALDHAAGT